MVEEEEGTRLLGFMDLYSARILINTKNSILQLMAISTWHS